MEQNILTKSNKIFENKKTKEICIRGKNLADGYLDPDSLGCIKFSDGWFKTSDIGLIQEKKLFLIVVKTIKLILGDGRCLLKGVKVIFYV